MWPVLAIETCSWLIGAYAVYAHDIPRYGMAFAFNVASSSFMFYAHVVGSRPVGL